MGVTAFTTATYPRGQRCSIHVRPAQPHPSAGPPEAGARGRAPIQSTTHRFRGRTEKKGNLERAVAGWHDILARLEPLEQRHEQSLRSREDLQALRARLN